MKNIFISCLYIFIIAFLHIYLFVYFDKISEPLKKDVEDEIFSEERSLEISYRLSTFDNDIKENILDNDIKEDYLDYLYKQVGHYANEVMVVELLRKELFENILKEKSDYINLGFVKYGIYIPDDLVNDYKKNLKFNEILAPFIKDNSCICFGEIKIDNNNLESINVKEEKLINIVKLHIIETEGIMTCEENISCNDAKLNGFYYFDVKRNIYYNEHILESIMDNIKELKEDSLKNHLTNNLIYIDEQHYKNYAHTYKFTESYTTIYKGVATYLIRAVSGYIINENFKKNFELYENEKFLQNLNTEEMKAFFEFSKGLNYFMISSHYDSSIQSPAVSDAGAYVAVMIELFRNLISRKIFLTPFILNFNGAEEAYLLSAHGFSNIHIWSLGVKYYINLDSIGYGGQFIIYRTPYKNKEILNFYKKYSLNPTFSSFANDAEYFTGNNTDYKAYNSYMKSSEGLDIVTCIKGYFYHTSHDNINNLKRGTMQHIGNNMLELISNILKDMHSDFLVEKKNLENNSKDNVNETNKFNFIIKPFKLLNTKINNLIDILSVEHYFFYDFIPNYVLVISKFNMLFCFFILAFLKFFLSLVEKKLYNREVSIYSTLLILLFSYILPLLLTLGILYLFELFKNLLNLKVFYYTNIFLVYLVYGSLAFISFYYFHYQITKILVGLLKKKEINYNKKNEKEKKNNSKQNGKFYDGRTRESLHIEQDVCLNLTEYSEINDEGRNEENKLVKNNKFDNPVKYEEEEISSKVNYIECEEMFEMKKKKTENNINKKEDSCNELYLYMALYGYNASFYLYMLLFLLAFFLNLGLSFILLFFASGILLVKVLTLILNVTCLKSNNKENKDVINFNCYRNKLFISHIPMLYIYSYIINISYWIIFSSVSKSGYNDITKFVTNDFQISVMVFFGIFFLITLFIPLLIMKKKEFKNINSFFFMIFFLSFIYILLFLKNPFSEKTLKRVNIAHVSIKVRDEIGNIVDEYNGLSFGLCDSLKLDKYGLKFLNNREDLKEIYLNEIKQYIDKENLPDKYELEFQNMKNLNEKYGNTFSIPYFCGYFDFVPYKSPIEDDIDFSEENKKDFYELDEIFDDTQNDLFEKNSLFKEKGNESNITINYIENKDLMNKNITDDNLKYELFYNGSIKTTLGYKKIKMDSFTRIYIQLKTSYHTYMNILSDDVINWSFDREFIDDTISHSLKDRTIRIIYGNNNRITRFWLDVKDYKEPLTIVTKSCSFINLSPIIQQLIQRNNIFYISKVNKSNVNISIKKSTNNNIPSYVTSIGGKCEINVWNV
ncbi:peptidase, putative [Plasmodium gallinaceum]|uniref:Peptidase, putative n=1 Tax=Plasmodium gallinaceum TaxID=5849 RepID=A0A1J1GNW3_PLAGA|nr:peptidase, putative [Plasmodium gallinaceum]CRG94146.1 peptidase, putative [Plasmodium gallinaceum]